MFICVSRVRCVANREQHSNTVVMMSILTSYYCAYREKAASNFKGLFGYYLLLKTENLLLKTL